MSNPRGKLDNFARALKALHEGLKLFDPASDLQRDGVIQRFEFTFELAWKSLQAYFDDEGTQGVNSPKGALREAYGGGLIQDEALWLAMLRDRNMTAYLYDAELAAEIVHRIQEHYAAALAGLKQALEERIES